MRLWQWSPISAELLSFVDSAGKALAQYAKLHLLLSVVTRGTLHPIQRAFAGAKRRLHVVSVTTGRSTRARFPTSPVALPTRDVSLS